MKRKAVAAIALIAILMISACSKSSASQQVNTPTITSTGRIYLYGEQHGVEKILNEELSLWGEHYHNESMRHLFIEMPYYTAELLNMWMQSESDEILDAVYEDWDGTASYNPIVKEFYQQIKEDYPETIFHGTDVGHQYGTTGNRFSRYLVKNDLKDSEQYVLTQDNIYQGRFYYKNSDNAYRENKMSENFIREFEALNGESVMGIYGGAHTNPEAMAFNANDVPSMAKQLRERYGDALISEDLSLLAKAIEPLRTDVIKVAGKDYEAYYYGKQDLTGFKDFTCREFWRLENAYDDFKDARTTGEMLPYNNYPMLIEDGQVFVIDFTKTDGSVYRMYYRSDGNMWEGMPSTEELVP